MAVGNIQTIIINPGQKAYIPTDAKILNIVSTGDSVGESSCINLEVTPPTCYKFEWEEVWSTVYNNYNIEAIVLDGVEYATVAPTSLGSECGDLELCADGFNGLVSYQDCCRISKTVGSEQAVQTILYLGVPGTYNMVFLKARNSTNAVNETDNALAATQTYIYIKGEISTTCSCGSIA